MTDENVYKLQQEHIETIEAIVGKGDRVEIIPVKDGLRILRIRREEVKPDTNSLSMF